MAFDNLCKLLSEKYPDRFAAWILGQTPTTVQVLKTELSIEPIRADSVTFLQTRDRILHLEFQVKLESDPPLPLRMLDYWVRLHRLYRLPITQVVVLLLPPSEGTIIETAFVLEATQHRYQVVRMWEQNPEIFLNDAALLPLAPLAAAPVPEQLLNQFAQQVSRIESVQQRREASSYAQILAGLKFNKALIRQVFQEGMMRESVIYQEILEEGLREGRQQGWQQGEQQGREEGLRRGRHEAAVMLVLRQLTRRFGLLDETMRSSLTALPLNQLEDLSEALLDFAELSDLEQWLQTHGSGSV